MHVDKYEMSSDFISNKVVSVAGRLHENFSFWKETLQAMDAVLDIIRNGHGLPFTSIPQGCFIRNKKSALKHPKFVEDAIFKLLEVSSPPRCINPLSVAKGKKLRSVLDLRHVNPHLHCPKFKYDDLACLSEIFEQNFWFFTWDLKSGYQHVSIRYEHRCFFRMFLDN